MSALRWLSCGGGGKSRETRTEKITTKFHWNKRFTHADVGTRLDVHKMRLGEGVTLLD